MELADLFEKIANNARLTPEELSFLSLTMRNTQLNFSYIDGLKNGSSSVNAAKIAAHKFVSGFQSMSNNLCFFSGETTLSNDTTTKAVLAASYKHSNFSASSGDITVPETGLYRVVISAAWDANATGIRTVQGRSTNYAPNELVGSMPAITGGNPTYIHIVTDFMAIETTEFFYVNVYQNSGGNLDVNVAVGITKVSDFDVL